MSKRPPKPTYIDQDVPLHRISRNIDTRVQIHSPTVAPPKAVRPITPLHPAGRYRVCQSRPGSSTFLRPDSARNSSADRLHEDEITAIAPLPALILHENSDNNAAPKQARLRTHKNWHKSTGSWSTQTSSRQRLIHIDEHVLAVSVTMLLTLLVAIALPLAAILPQKYVIPLPVNVMVPLYIDPEGGSWGRLAESMLEYPDTNFTLIINPAHGPGWAAWPSGTYIMEIKKLNKLPNVQTVGYIDIQRGQRDNATIQKEIDTYAGWNNSSIAVCGIFFDHTPIAEWDSEANGTAQAYMKNISKAVKLAEGINQPRLVIHNPGTIPGANLSMGFADITVVFEGAYKEMPAIDEVGGRLAGFREKRDGLAYWAHTIPHEIGRSGVRKVIDQTRRSVEWLFLSDQGGDGRYERYSEKWEEFLELTW